MIPSDDRGFALGDGLFETILTRDGELVLFEAHLDRLEAGCVLLGLPPLDLETARAAALKALADAGLTSQRAAVRLSWTAGSGGRGLDRPDPLIPRLAASAAPAPKPAQPATLATASIRRNQTSPTSRLKTLAYLDQVLSRREATGAGADEALLLNMAGEIACAGVANLFWIEGGQLKTPALECGVLAGVMRREVLKAAEGLGLAVESVRATSLASAEAVFLTNSLIGVRPVSRLDDREFGAHRLVADLASAVAAFS